MSKQSKDGKLLTDVELELMNILWETDGGTVNDVISKLPKERDLAYTSVSTILRILEQKKVLKSRKQGRGHFYIPVLKKEDYGKKTLSHIVENVFNNTPLSLVKTLLDSKDLKKEELEDLKKLLNERLKS